MKTKRTATAIFPDQTAIKGEIQAEDTLLNQVLFRYKQENEPWQELWIPVSFIYNPNATHDLIATLLGFDPDDC